MDFLRNDFTPLIRCRLCWSIFSNMAEKDINDMITAAKRKRGANWSAEEEIALIEEVIKFEPRLFGKFKGAGMKGKHGKLKEDTWQTIADTLNS